MRRLLPAFVQRRLLLSAARRALAAGRPEAALEILRDGILAADPRAAGLRALILPLIPAPPPAPPNAASNPASRACNSRGDLRELLAQMRAGKTEKPDSAFGVSSMSHSADAPAASEPRARPLRLRMSLDDAGSFLICAGTNAIVGHSRAGQADVPILADVLPCHARFVLEPASFHAGARWRVEPIANARAWVAGEALGGEGRALQSGDLIQLAAQTSLRFDHPDRASLSATLDLQGGLEAAGAKRILLFAPGLEGRLSIGSKGPCHVQALLGGVELELVHDGRSLVIHCASGLIPDEVEGATPMTQAEVPLQLLRARHLRLCMPSASERPRWISLAPLEDA